jgi:CelD/BcsL family acetyltransferase involved in cellulose biosynthesis
MLSTPQSIIATPTTSSGAAGAARLDYLHVEEWQEFVESHPESMAFHHRNWIEAIAGQYGLELHIPCLKRGGEILAAIPFLASRSLLGARKLSSLPFSDYVRILGSHPRDAQALVTRLMTEHPPCDSMSLRTDTVLDRPACASHSVRHEVKLPRSLAELCKMIKPSAHRNLHKGRRIGLEFVKRIDADAVQDFYQLHVLTRRKLGVPVQPKRFFRLLRERVLAAGLGYVGLVLNAGRPVAAGVFLTFNRTVIYKYAASLPAALTDRPNDWLVYSALQHAAEEGYETFDFGISDRNQDGLRRFKCNWGAEESDVHTVQLVGPAQSPVEDSALFRMSSLVIRHSPTIACRCLGEVFYRFAT